jgi:hypothetical protein
MVLYQEEIPVFGQRWSQFVIGSVVCLGLVGCNPGGGLVPAKGKVIYKGQPVAKASVTFVRAEGTPATGMTDEKGEFQINTGGKPGVAKGEYKVTVTKFETKAAQTTMSPDDMRKMQMGRKAEKPKSEIPEKYASPDRSGLTANVTSDASKNVFEFTLTD